MNVSNSFVPSYIPALHDLIFVQIPELSVHDIPYCVVSVIGSLRQNKVTLLCSQGTGKEHHNVHLIWKKGMSSWLVWFEGKKYTFIKVKKA